MPSKYISQKQRLTDTIFSIIKEHKEIKQKKLISLVCIQGFIEKEVSQMIDHYKTAGIILYNKLSDIILLI